MAQRPTIMDVAREAGVSKVTVSYVLNGQTTSARISAGTAERVLEAAKSLGYTRNAIARMMVTKRCMALGVVFQQAQYFTVWSSFTNEVMHGICQASVANGYDIMLHTGALSCPAAEAEALSDGRVDGVLVLRNRDDETLLELLKRPLPAVLFFTSSDDPDVPFVDCDNFAGGQIATKHLIGLGHREIGFISGAKESTSSNDRMKGYESVLREYGIQPNPAYRVEIPEREDPEHRLYQLLRSTKRPTAIFCWSDDTALYCLELAKSIGIDVPRELSIVGFDSLAPSERSQPPLTSVSQPVRDIARAATEMLIKLAREEHVERRQLVFPVKLDIRGTTAPPLVKA